MVLPPVMTGLVIAGVILTLSVGAIAAREHPNPLSLPLVLLCTGAGVWLLPIGISYHTYVVEHHIWLQRIRYLGTAMVPLAYYLVAFKYAGYRQFTKPIIIAGLSVVPVVTVTLVWTTHLHGLFWETLEVVHVAGVWMASFEHGPWFTVHLVWAYGLILIAFVVLIRVVARADAHHRNQAFVVFVGAAVPLTLNVGHFAGIGTLGQIDLTPIAIGIGAAILGVGVLMFDLVELRPVARDRLIEQLRDGVIVLDSSGRIRESNPVARHVLEQQGEGPTGADALPEHLRTDGVEVEATVNGRERSYRIEVHEFYDVGGRVGGKIVYLNDITEIARREQRISVLHRVLRHNIRNEMTILFGHLEYVQRDAGDTAGEDIRQIERSADRIMGFAENARLIERTLKRETDTETVDVPACIHRAIEEVKKGNGDIVLEHPGDPTVSEVTVVDRELLVRALAELIENAVVHGSGAVEVNIRTGSAWIDIEIINEGPGIPDGEIAALEAPVETSLEHGSGLGLWVARWTADLSGGELRFGRNNGTNIVSLRLPTDSE